MAVGISERSRKLSGRVLTLTLRSRAMGGRQVVTVLLPRGYNRRRRYHVLYLLHGAGGNHRSWLDEEQVQRALGSLPVIAVMPDGSRTGPRGRPENGGYSDWFGTPRGAAGSAPAWESYHVRELVPFIDRTFATLRGPAGRAVAGISMGGSGAIKYAAEFPGTFGYAASLSGGLDSFVARGLVQDCKWGEFPRDAVVWRDNNPTDLAPNLRGVRLFVRSGDGRPGPFDSPTQPQDPLAGGVWLTRLVIEAGAHQMAEHFLVALRRAGVHGVNAHFYRGSHSHPYWRHQLPGLVAWLRVQFRHPPRARRSFAVASAHPFFTAWGWRFRLRQHTREFIHVRVRGRRLTVKGRGRLEVTVPRSQRPLRLTLHGKSTSVTVPAASG